MGFTDSLTNATNSLTTTATQAKTLYGAGLPLTTAISTAASINLKSKFRSLARKSGFGDSSGNSTLIMIGKEDPSDSGAGIIMLIMIAITILILVFGFKSISVLCPGNWMATHWILLFLLIMTGGNIGLVYIIMAYLLKMKIC